MKKLWWFGLILGLAGLITFRYWACVSGIGMMVVAEWFREDSNGA